MSVRHFRNLLDMTPAELEAIISRANKLRQMQQWRDLSSVCGAYAWHDFEKSSTRTRISFEAGMGQFGGHAIFLSPKDTQLGRRRAYRRLRQGDFKYG